MESTYETNQLKFQEYVKDVQKEMASESTYK